jgi:hypothetical protein
MKIKHIPCKHIFRYICENLDQDLGSPQCREIKKHLDACPNCIAYLDSLKTTIRLYREYPHPKFTEKSREKLYKTIKIHSKRSSAQ